MNIKNNMNMRSIIYIVAAFTAGGLVSCEGNGPETDAYGNFEATEVLISAETNGKLLSFTVKEGTSIEKGTVVGLVDTIPLYYKKKQLHDRIDALSTKTLDIPSQINVLIERKNNLTREKNRIEKLLSDGAATQKQYDDISGEIDVVDSELIANRKRLETNNRGLLSEIKPLETQIAEINDMISKSILVNPVSGTVLDKFAEENEIVSFARPLYRIADLKEILLRAYLSGDQLDDIKIGQQVKVLIDEDKDNFKEYPGTIIWISDKAEFTPKIVQTKEDRVNLVYAMKILVNNDGYIKIGMPGEVIFN